MHQSLRSHLRASAGGRHRGLVRALVILVLVLVLVAGALAVAWWGAGRFAEAGSPFVYHTVKRGDLAIMVIERGTLESRQSTDIKCEVESLGFEQSGIAGTQIIRLVPNGQQVEQGELLVELDDTVLRERVDAQVLVYEQAKAKQIQAQAKYENQITQNQTALAEAELQDELAKLELKRYSDGDDGTFQIALQEIDLKIQEAKNQIAESKAALAMRATERNGIRMLFRLGYRGEGELEQAQYAYLQAEDSLVRATNALATTVASRRKLQEYDFPMEQLKLKGAVQTAQRSVLQVQRDNASLLAQVEAEKVAADATAEKELEKLEKYRSQLEKCKIYAPHAGMVAHNTSTNAFIAEGEFVNQRQTILQLPDLTDMQVVTEIHESMRSSVHSGLPATVTIHNRGYRGTVQSVAVLPESGGMFRSQIKTYKTVISIDEVTEGLQPGISALVAIQVERLENVVSVPVQAVVQSGNETWCYVRASGGPQRRSIRTLRSNGKFVAIEQGLQEGEQVVLNAIDVIDLESDNALSASAISSVP